MKKIFALLTAVVLSLWTMSWITMANWSTSSSYTTVYSNWLNFSATKDWDSVKMSWGNFGLPAWETRHYWKVVRSDSNHNPVYPDDSYIKYDWNINFSNYTDYKYKKWYYRVCAITSKDWYRKRYCSNVVKIDSDNNNNTTTSSNTNTSTNTRWTPTTTATTYTNNYNLSAWMKSLLSDIAVKFMKKLNTEYEWDIDGEVKKLEAVVLLFKTIKVTNVKTQAIFRYLAENLEEQLWLLQARQILGM